MTRHLLAAAALVAAGSLTTHANAQAVAGKVTSAVTNSFGRGIGLSLMQCSNCTYNPQPPSSIATGTTGTNYILVPTPGIYAQSTVRYNVSVNGVVYECQFRAMNLVRNGSGSCGTPTISASATSGQYPSPTCTKGMPSTPDATCNYSVSFMMAQ